MAEEEKTPNSIYMVDDLLEDIFLQLPLDSILKSKTVSKQWKSILESKKFIERSMSLQKSRKILPAYNCDCGEQPKLLPELRFQGDEELVYIHCNAARPSMTCDGLVCLPEKYWINVLNPWTRQLRRFRYGMEAFSPENRALGFGRNKVTGSYKVFKMCYMNHVLECSVLDVETGDWKMLSPPRYKVDSRRKSVCVNGSIYWLQNFEIGYKILALDLHKEEFYNVSVVPSTSVTQETTLLVNLEDRLAMASTYTNPLWKLEVWSMDTKEERWSKTYSISLAGKGILPQIWIRWFMPIAVSKQGNLVFNDNHKRLFKYYPKTDAICCLSSNTCVISPFFENLAQLPLKSTLPFPHPRRTSKCRLLSKRNEFGIIDILLTTLVVVCNFWLPL